MNKASRRGFASLNQHRLVQRLALAAATAAVAAMTAGCAAPLLLGGAAVGGAAMVATDRRTAATQLEDQSIELKARGRIRDLVGDREHISVNSYNRLVLLTGEVNTEADKTAVEQGIAKIENVKTVVNDLAVQWPSSMSSRSNDVVLQGKVKATLIDAKGLPSNAFNVVVERGVVYLQGRVTEAEATRAIDLTRAIPGVQKVVRVMEIVTEADLAASRPK